MTEIVRYKCPCCNMLVLEGKIKKVLSAENDFEVQVQKRQKGENGFGKAKRPQIQGCWLEKKRSIARNLVQKGKRMFDECKDERIYRCPQCETVVARDDEDCPNCGANFLPVIDMADKIVIFDVENEKQCEYYCEKCESLVDENATECPHCGVEFVDEDER